MFNFNVPVFPMFNLISRLSETSRDVSVSSDFI